jgi:hypothetical protein
MPFLRTDARSVPAVRPRQLPKSLIARRFPQRSALRRKLDEKAIAPLPVEA